jgi:hypothetical protein
LVKHDKKDKTYSVGARRLRATGLSCDDDLVDGEDSPGGLGGELDGPVLGEQEVENAVVLGVQRAGAVVIL